MPRYRVLWVNGRKVYEHRKVWQDANGPIPPGHDIHHINGNGLDNRLENLALIQRGPHIARHRLGVAHSQATVNKMRRFFPHQAAHAAEMGIVPEAPSDCTRRAIAQELERWTAPLVG